MASNTVYKDELIRVGVLLGLPDTAEPAEIGGAITATAAGFEAEAQLRGAAEAGRSVAREGLEALCVAAEQAALALLQRRERAGGTQAYADMTAVADALTAQARLARELL